MVAKNETDIPESLHTRIHAYTHIQDCSGGGTSNYASGCSDNFSRYDGLVKWWYLASSAGQPSGTAVTDTAVVVALSGAYDGGGNDDGDGSSEWLATAIGDGSAAPDGQYRCYSGGGSSLAVGAPDSLV